MRNLSFFFIYFFFHFFLDKTTTFSNIEMFRVIANAENEFVFSTNPQLFWKIDLKLCTYFTEEKCVSAL